MVIIKTMTKKENQSRGGNGSLLQTARTKNYGAGKFANLVGVRSKPNHDDTEVESGVLGMAMSPGNSLEYSLSKAYISGTANDVAGNGEQGAVPSTSFFSLWPLSTGAVDPDPDHHLHHHDHRHHHHQQQHPQQFKSKKFAKATAAGAKEAAVMSRKTMDISKGLRFSAPAPMTLNRYQPQMGQEKNAPESREYLERQAMWEQQQKEAKHMAEAKMTIEEWLKQAFGLEEIGTGEDHVYDENRNAGGNIPTKKKKLMKKILGKVRPKPSTKLQQNQEKSSAIQAAMAAAAAAVEAATGNPSGPTEGRNRPMTEGEARAIVSHALSVSRQNKKPPSMHELLDDMFRPSAIERDRNKMAPQAVDDFGRPLHFPVNEVMMKRNNEDSVSDLDASLRNARNMPVAEIHMNSSRQYYESESVSTLGTPRVFEQLDKLLLSEPRGLQQRPGIIRDFLEDNMGGSAAPPPMVTSHDARALIDQLDSGTMVGDMTAGTARAENAVHFCNLASNCFHLEHKSLFVEASTRNDTFQSNISALGEESFDDSETSSQENTNDETWASPVPAFTQAIDNAIRKAEIQIASTQNGHRTSLSRNKEVRERISSNAGSPLPSPRHGEIDHQPAHETANFDAFMNVVETKLNKVDEQKQNNEKTVSVMDEGRFLLEKDDAYWDTLSTIASTANDQSSESDAYMDEFIQPGPIPGEITTPSGEMKPVTTPVLSGEGTIDKNLRMEEGFSSRHGGNLNQIINDVTDLIDADLLDNLPISKNRHSNISLSLKPENDSGVIDRNKNSKPSKRKMNKMKPRPEAVDGSKIEETKSGNLATAAASQIVKGIRSVSWGVEEIYEDKNRHSDLSDQDTDNSGSSYGAPKSRPYPEGMHRNHRKPEYSDDVLQPREEEDLLSRTLELSKGLLETIMGSQLVQEKRTKEVVQNVGSDDSIEVESDSHLDGNPKSTESRDDFDHDDKIREDDPSPAINSKLESLRNQRSRALSKFRTSQMQMSPSNTSEKIEVAKRDRERSTNHSLSHDYGKLRSAERDHAEYSTYPKAVMKYSQSNDSDIDLKYTTSDSNASTTPSQKARELRIQLDEAMRVSREIQMSQNELGNELNSFKRKYYKNPEIQHNFATKTARDF